ncbi:MAG: hypothetical protein Q8O00_08050 [Holophaga sp.]|nr:hypothetical protein [Holophaga sp.]
MRNTLNQRGEGKVGCIVSLLVLAILGAVGIKAIPVLYSNNELSSAVDDVAARAGILPQATIELQLRQKIKELDIPEALAPGAVVVKKSGDAMAGTCTVHVNYTRKIDFFGLYTYPLTTNTTKSIPFVDAR